MPGRPLRAFAHGLCRSAVALAWGVLIAACAPGPTSGVVATAQVGDAADGAREGVSPRAELVALANRARSEPRACGDSWFDAAEPLQIDPTLMDVAQAHSEDQRALGVATHVGPEGRGPSGRVEDSVYEWSRVGENVASGYDSAQSLVRAVLDSEGHCANLMDPDFRHTGVGLSGGYWTQVFATPR
ncbi:MAG: CAP domain-containing protein [Trueperaceae bacterium]|nr:CAP domain-containing protein [Trueperaceae bacterium]